MLLQIAVITAFSINSLLNKMLKNKKAIYILLPLVIFIWGIVIYNIFSSMGGGSEIVLVNTAIPEESVSRQIAIDTFSITANYRDPFLGKIVSGKPKPIKKQFKKRPPIKKKPIQPIRWPSISYGGMIRNQQTNKLIAMVKINGKDNLMNEGGVVAGISTPLSLQ